LEESYEGPRHFDAHLTAAKTRPGVWEFAAGCMRNYLILKDKARQFNEDPEIQALLAEIHATPVGFADPLGDYSPRKSRSGQKLCR